MKAFPQTTATVPATPSATEPLENYQGMDLLDYFAAKAMAALISDPNLDVEMSSLAKISYEYAQAMMKERTK
jgi:hypothetical protein